MKKILSVALAALLSLSLVACGGNSSSARQENSGASEAGTSSTAGGSYSTSLDDIKAKGQLVIGLDDTFAPMGFRDENGELVGFDIDLATAVCEELGVEAVFSRSTGLRKRWNFPPVRLTACGTACPLPLSAKRQ